MMVTSVFVKIVGAFYKIPLTNYIGAVGRGYFASAYNICLPIHIIVMGAFPVALSKLVSKYNATGDYQTLHSLRKASRQVFFVIGFVGMGIVLLLSKPYSKYIASSPNSFYTILILAPSILFSSLGASYEDYYEGLMNMRPTSIAQTIDALSKMIFGLLFARITMLKLLEEYQNFGTVLGSIAQNDSQALSLIYPYSSASAMLGALLGTIISFSFVFVYDLIHREKNIIVSNACVKYARKELVSFAFPIMISCTVQSVFQFLDTASIQYSLGKIDSFALHNYFSNSSNVQINDLPSYAYGIFSVALDFKNLIPGITMALGVCSVPAISREFELKNKPQLEILINSVYKYTSLISMLGGIALTAFSRDILTLFYSNSSDIILGCDKLVKGFGLTVFLYSLSGVVVYSVQAIGLSEKSIKPYIVSGIIRVVLNIILVNNSNLILFGAVISGAVGYLVMFVWNYVIVIKNTKIKLSLLNIVFKPIIVSGISLYFCLKIIEMLDFTAFSLLNLLIKMLVLCVIFCILCFSLKLLKFNDIFLHFKN